MISYGKHFIDDDDIEAVVNVLKSDSLTQGPNISRFEEEVAHYVGSKYAVAVTSGTAALHLACLALDLTSDDCVVTSPNTFVASSNCALYCRAKVTFADIDPETLNIDPIKLESVINRDKCIKAIIPVHYAGLPCDMAKISSIANNNGAYIIEDASHALGAYYDNGNKVGSCSYSDMTVFSLHPVKLIAAGEGGVITTNSDKLYKRLIRLRSHGINKGNDKFEAPNLGLDSDGLPNRWYYEMQELGFNYRMTDIQAALASSQLKKLSMFLQKRTSIAKKYDDIFKYNPSLKSMQIGHREQSANHLYVVSIDFDKIGISRNKFMSLMADVEIITQVHYIPVHLHPYYKKKGFKLGDYPCSEQNYLETLSLPIYYSLTDKQQQYVIDNINRLTL